MICRLVTFPSKAGPGSGSLQNGFQLPPSKTARLSASALSPAFWNVPPAKILPADAVMAETRPLEICEDDELIAVQPNPFQKAMRSALGTPPASVNSPPTMSTFGVATTTEEATRSSESPPAWFPVPRWSQPPGPVASAHVAIADAATTDRARTRRRRRVPVEPGRPIDGPFPFGNGRPRSIRPYASPS